MFDRSMFVVLDGLHQDLHPCRTLAETWITHSVQRGDIARLLEPVLLILLHADTARYGKGYTFNDPFGQIKDFFSNITCRYVDG